MPGDPALVVAYQINRLWDAYNGAETEMLEAKKKGDATQSTILGERCAQIAEWRDALELIGT
jgi:hypothetical protein